MDRGAHTGGSSLSQGHTLDGARIRRTDVVTVGTRGAVAMCVAAELRRGLGRTASTRTWKGCRRPGVITLVAGVHHGEGLHLGSLLRPAAARDRDPRKCFTWNAHHSDGGDASKRHCKSGPGRVSGCWGWGCCALAQFSGRHTRSGSWAPTQAGRTSSTPPPMSRIAAQPVTCRVPFHVKQLDRTCDVFMPPVALQLVMLRARDIRMLVVGARGGVPCQMFHVEHPSLSPARRCLSN